MRKPCSLPVKGLGEHAKKADPDCTESPLLTPHARRSRAGWHDRGGGEGVADDGEGAAAVAAAGFDNEAEGPRRFEPPLGAEPIRYLRKIIEGRSTRSLSLLEGSTLRRFRNTRSLPRQSG